MNKFAKRCPATVDSCVEGSSAPLAFHKGAHLQLVQHTVDTEMHLDSLYSMNRIGNIERLKGNDLACAEIALVPDVDLRLVIFDDTEWPAAGIRERLGEIE